MAKKGLYLKIRHWQDGYYTVWLCEKDGEAHATLLYGHFAHEGRVNQLIEFFKDIPLEREDWPPAEKKPEASLF